MAIGESSRAVVKAVEATTLPRRRTRGSAPRRRPVAPGATSNPATPAPASRSLRRNWRATLVGALIGFLIVLMLVMKWLLDFQVAAAAKRHEEEMAARAAAAHCFELGPHRAAEACRAGERIDDLSAR
ncbi:hypothetical protein WKW80_22210 [Variovorax humicola]|uniref:General secretion pathway protein GspL n=1 Tax=Variovorax humicola TaxID=1769758 RepID=A0ABU8W529_9BURK